MERSYRLIVVIFIIFVAILGVLFVANISGKNSGVVLHAEKCEDAECFWQKVKDCTKAEYILEENAGNIETKLTLEVLRPKNGGCEISAKLLSMKFNPVEGLSQEILSSIQDYLDKMNGREANCIFDVKGLDKGLEKNPFTDSSFVTMENCSGELKEFLLKLESNIEKRIRGE